MTRIIEPIKCNSEAYIRLATKLTDKRPDDPREGYERIEGFHPRCGGNCTIISEQDEDGNYTYTIQKPHIKCEPIGCIVPNSRCGCSGSLKPLPLTLLDCMN